MLETLIALVAVQASVDIIVSITCPDDTATSFAELLFGIAVTALVVPLVFGAVPVALLLTVIVSRAMADTLRFSIFGRSDASTVLAIVWNFLTSVLVSRLLAADLANGLWAVLLGDGIRSYVVALLVFDLIAINVFTGSKVVGFLVKKFADQVDISLSGIIGAGRYIGILERILTLFLVMIGQYAAVGFLITAKSIMRIGDIREDWQRRMAEYVIIGTFLSFGWSLITATIGKYVYDRI